MSRPTVIGAFLLAGCLGGEPEPAESVNESAVTTPASGQGTSWQGTSWQGTSWQGTSWQGTSWQGGTYGSSALIDGSLIGTKIVAWRELPDATWEQRFPDEICRWNASRTAKLTCTSVDLDVSPSPLAGASWPATFVKADGTILVGAVRIGSSPTDVGAVRADTSRAMFALDGHAGSQACPIVPHGPSCDNPHGCRVNCDLWLYDVDVLDGNGQAAALCPSGESAFALQGTWDETGTHDPSTTQFTFACTNGTIAKCTRWGYRPFDLARKTCNTPGCTPRLTLYSLAPYHQVCVRGAAADYCGTRHSFTKDGTLVDVYDYYPKQSTYPHGYGFIPRTRDGLVHDTVATAFVFESAFDRLGAMYMDHLRYAELTDLENPAVGCPGRFTPAGDDVGTTYNRDSSTWVTPVISFDSTPACAHTEQTVGKWLHQACSQCTNGYFNGTHCTDPNSPQGWDATCVQRAQTLCTSSQRMASHSECSTGGGLSKLDSGCTLAVCLANPSCCTIGKAQWTPACVNAANATCTGGKEGVVLQNGVKRKVGFCGF